MVQLIDLKVNGNDTGKLISIESERNLPFECKRVFYIYSVKDDVKRGLHANRNSRFAFVCLSGSVHIYSHDGKNEYDHLLDEPSKMLVMNNMVWKEMYDFSEDAVLMVLSDCLYNVSEYIYDFDEFLSEVNHV